MPPYHQTDPEKYATNRADHEEQTLERMSFLAAIDKREQRQKCHPCPLGHEAEKFAGKNFQGLVVGKKIPFRLDVGRRLERIGRNEGILGEKQVGVEKDHQKKHRQKDADGNQILDDKVGEKGNAAGMVLVAVAVSFPGDFRVLLPEGGSRDADTLEQEQVQSDQGEDAERDYRNMKGKETTEGVGADQLSAAQELNQITTDDRDRPGAVGSNGGCPVGELAPGEQIAGQRNAHDQIENDETGEPAQFPRPFIAAHEQDRKHVQDQDQHHHIRPDGV